MSAPHSHLSFARPADNRGGVAGPWQIRSPNRQAGEFARQSRVFCSSMLSAPVAHDLQDRSQALSLVGENVLKPRRSVVVELLAHAAVVFEGLQTCGEG